MGLTVMQGSRNIASFAEPIVNLFFVTVLSNIIFSAIYNLLINTYLKDDIINPEFGLLTI